MPWEGFLDEVASKHWLSKDQRAKADPSPSACSAGDLGSIPGPGRSSGEENGSPLQYSCLENPQRSLFLDLCL